MAEKNLAIIVLAAGKGTRMKSDLPKVMHKVAHKPMISHVLDTAKMLSPDKLICVVGPDMDALSDLVAPVQTVIQEERKGTGDAVKTALPLLEEFKGTVLILYGDSPLISSQTLQALLHRHAADDLPAVTVLGMTPPDPYGFGRLILDNDGTLNRIVEQKDATEAEAAVPYCNSGFMAIDGLCLKNWLDRLESNNAQGEFYLTDVPAKAIEDGRVCVTIEGNYAELIGVNNRAQLAQIEGIYQSQRRIHFMEQGVTFIDPTTVYFAADTEIAADVVIEPNVFFGEGVTISSGAHIKAFSHIEGAVIGKNTMVGPFARLRPGSKIGAEAKIGNFVEVKKSVLEDGAKVSHLSYIGDAHVGEATNIGAGTITCNYDGVSKYSTEIGPSSFIGSNSTLVAPVKVGAGAYIAAGSSITEDVPSQTLAFGRARQTVKPLKREEKKA